MPQQLTSTSGDTDFNNGLQELYPKLLQLHNKVKRPRLKKRKKEKKKKERVTKVLQSRVDCGEASIPQLYLTEIRF